MPGASSKILSFAFQKKAAANYIHMKKREKRIALKSGLTKQGPGAPEMLSRRNFVLASLATASRACRGA